MCIPWPSLLIEFTDSIIANILLANGTETSYGDGITDLHLTSMLHCRTLVELIVSPLSLSENTGGFTYHQNTPIVSKEVINVVGNKTVRVRLSHLSLSGYTTRALTKAHGILMIIAWPIMVGAAIILLSSLLEGRPLQEMVVVSCKSMYVLFLKQKKNDWCLMVGCLYIPVYLVAVGMATDQHPLN